MDNTDLEKFKCLAARLRSYCDSHPVQDSQLIAEAAEAIDKLLGIADGSDSVVRVETPFGVIAARSSGFGPDYPGITVDLIRDEGKTELPLALIEYTDTEGDLPDCGHIITRVWRDCREDEYPDRVVHERIEK